MKALLLTSTALSLSLLAGCATSPQYRSSDTGYRSNDRSYSRNVCRDCGVVEDVQEVAYREQGLGLGAVIGAVAGAALGNTVGKGDGRRAATVAGAVAGGAIGHNVQRNNRRAEYAFRYEIRLDDGRYATVTQVDDAGIRRGDRVRIENDRVFRY